MQSERSSQTDCSKNRAFRWSASRPNMEKDRVGRREGKKEGEKCNMLLSSPLKIFMLVL